jgi:hypothetical protein
MSQYLVLVAAALMLAVVGPRAVDAVSPEQAASYCYEQAKKMGFSSRDMEDRSWEDCMSQFHRPAQAPPPSLTPEQRAFLLQQLQQPAANPGLEAGRGMLRGLCNSEGGYYTPDGQCIRPQTPAPQLPSRRSWQCQQNGNSTNCWGY